jgi:mannose-1-phosphate guanylyltransferase
MARNNSPKTARITVGGTTLTINQNGRVTQGYTEKAAKELFSTGEVYWNGGMIFVTVPVLARAFGIA